MDIRLSGFWGCFREMTVSDRIKQAVRESEETPYAIAKGSGVAARTLYRFLSGDRPNIRASTIDALCEYLGLELRPVRSPRTPRKQTEKKTATSRKQSRKK